MKKVCITGGSGILGTSLVRLNCEKVFVDRKDPHPLLKGQAFHQFDIRDREKMEAVLKGFDVLIHLAGSMGQQSDWDQSQSNILQDNIEGLISVLDAAKNAKVERVIFASSNHVVGMHEIENAPTIYEYGHGISIDESVPIRPDSFYGVSKAFGETYGRYLAENGGPKCYVMRIGSVRDESEDHPYAYAEWGVRKGKWERGSREYALQENRLKALWMSRRDFQNMVERLIHHDGPVFDVFNAVSNNERKWLDIDHAKEKLEFDPEDNSEGWVQIMTEWKGQSPGAPDMDPSNRSIELGAVIPVKVSELDDLDLIERLLDLSLASLQESRFLHRVFLATQNEKLANRARKMGIEVPFLRDPILSESHVRADQVLQQYVIDLEKNLNYTPALMAPVEITYPFRPAGLYDHLVGKLLEEKLNTVIAGMAENRPVWIKKSENLVRLDEYEKMRDEREPLHVGLASLGCVTYREVIAKGSRFGSRIGVFEINHPIASVEIRDFQNPELFNRMLSAYRK